MKQEHFKSWWQTMHKHDKQKTGWYEINKESYRNSEIHGSSIPYLADVTYLKVMQELNLE